MNLNNLDGLYIEDPYNGNVLKPEFCYIDFPSWPNPNRAKPNNPWIPAVPFAPPPRDRENQESLQEIFKKLRGELEYFTKTKDSLKFRLEMAGFAKEDVSVSVGENKFLNVNSKNGQKPYNKVFTIPDAENYNLANSAAQMSNGLLEIFFTPKKEEIKTIKIL